MITAASEGQLDTAIFDGESARALLSNPVLTKALDDIEAAAINAMVEAHDEKERESKWYMTRAVRDLKKKLLVVANAGTAAKELKAKRAKNG